MSILLGAGLAINVLLGLVTGFGIDWVPAFNLACASFVMYIGVAKD